MKSATQDPTTWFGGLPSTWRLVRLKELGRFSASGVDKKVVPGEPIVSLVNYTDVYGNRRYSIDSQTASMEVSAPKSKLAIHTLRRGDLLFQPSSEVADDIGASAVIAEDLENTTYSYHVLRFRFTADVYTGFRKYLCNILPVLKQFSRLCRGTTRMILDRGDFRNTWVALPPRDLQPRIARYLDGKLEAIDRYLRVKEREIALLEERKRALIHRAVTRGLDPNPQLQPSGIPWLPEIPVGWEVVRFKHFYKCSMGQTILANDLQEGGTHPVISATEGNTYFGRISHPRFVLESGDFVIPARGVSIGAVKRISEPCVSTQTTIYAKEWTTKPSNPDFVFYYLHGGRAHLFEYDRTAIPQLTVDQVKNNPLLLPPLAVQGEIVTMLEEETRQLITTITRARHQIERMQEYRTALIAEAVTGKIAVQ